MSPPPTVRSAWPNRCRAAAPEILAVLAFAATWVVLRAHGITQDAQTLAYTFKNMAPGLFQAGLVGIGLHSAWRLVRREPILAYWRDFVRPASALAWVRLIVAALVVTYAYMWLKVSVPVLNPANHDQALWDLDRMLHGGVSPAPFLAALSDGTPIPALIGRWYGLWIFTVLYGMSFLIALPDVTARREIMTSLVLAWAVGSWLYVAVPAHGPIYAFHGSQSELDDDLPATRALQARLLAQHERVVAAARGAAVGSINPTLGIAAFPSLHVGIHWLLALWLRRHARPLFVPALLGTFFTLIGSVLTGWHHAIDGYAGLLLAQACYHVGRATGSRSDSRPLAPAAAPPSSPEGEQSPGLPPIAGATLADPAQGTR